MSRDLNKEEANAVQTQENAVGVVKRWQTGPVFSLGVLFACLSGFNASWAQSTPALEESVQQVYVAFYGRPGDPDGVTYWAAQAAAAGVNTILNQFASSLEASQLFAGMSDEGKITFIYRVLFNRDPDVAGLAYWGSELSGGKRTLQEISFEVLKGAQNDDLTLIGNKVAASVFFSNELKTRNIKADYSSQTDIIIARNWIGTVSSTLASLDAAKAGISKVFDRISTAGRAGTISGVLATPSTVAKVGLSAAYFMPEGRKERASSSSSSLCFGVPDGYTPLSGATVTQIDAFGVASKQDSADDCGIFVTNTAPLTVALDINSTGYRPARSSISAFLDPDKNGLPDALTLIPTTSSYLLSGVRLSNNNQVFFNVTDSATNKAVLGLTASQVAITNNTSPMSISSFGYGASVSQTAASVSMVLDASGSMYGTPLQVAAASARLFVSRKASADQLSLTVFDGSVTFLDKAGTDAMVLNNRLLFSDASGAALLANAPLNGYTSNPLFPEQMLKLYDNRSDAWLKKDAFFNVSGGRYPFGGVTALYSAALKGINSLSTSTNRRYAVVMTDGFDNSSGSNTVDTVIAAAKANKVATYTVAAGTSVDVVKLKRMATETGGTYSQVADMTQVANLSAVFDAIRTNIAFDYAAQLPGTPLPGDLRVTVDVGGTPLQSTVIVAP